MDRKIELILVPVTDVDRARSFYVDQVGFHADYDSQVSDTLRFVQLTPPASACSIAFGTGITDMAPGSQSGVQVVVPDADEAWRHVRGPPAPGRGMGRARVRPRRRRSTSAGRRG
ncbi:catechol 2,3-dioxygenase-like lactoylglutathione lyase family enzyme [Cryobacterium psychrotolerans]|nr:catechol 2,3-dioxygenase-like lactoylglutathione lyase family enzyme [Cryobacterium psychrotolerans]